MVTVFNFLAQPEKVSEIRKETGKERGGTACCGGHLKMCLQYLFGVSIKHLKLPYNSDLKRKKPLREAYINPWSYAD